MPNRLLKESICTSEDLEKLSTGAENLFYRLITKADDFGAYYGNASIVKGTCLPLKSDYITSAQVSAWIDEIAKAGLVYLYRAEDGRKYIQFVKWAKHQNVRAQIRKYPEFDIEKYELPVDGAVCYQFKADAINCEQSQADAINCKQSTANVSVIQSNPIQKESNPKKIQKESNPSTGRRDYEKDDLFEAFWSAYPKKTGDIRQAYSEYLYAVENGTSPDVIIKAAVELCAEVEPEKIQFLTSAERWLRNKGWLKPANEGGKAHERKPDAANKPVSGKDPPEDGGKGKFANFKYDV